MKQLRIGLALGSGAGRGWAHIGVVRALARSGIDLNIICGTSIGALVGGVHLAGHLDALDAWARNLSKLNILRYLDLKVSGGLIGGERLAHLLDENLGDLSIEDLGLPFAAVAADLRTGHEVWLSSGRLVDALRASFALPGLFRPHRIDGVWLVDGALVNPIPVSVCRALGAQMVIAVNLNADIIGKHRRRHNASPGDDDAEDDLLTDDPLAGIGGTGARVRRSMLGQLFRGNDQTPSVFNVMVQSLNIIQDRLGRSRLAGDPPDVSITPQLGHIGLLEFDRAEEEIEEGEAAVARALPAIREAIDILG